MHQTSVDGWEQGVRRAGSEKRKHAGFLMCVELAAREIVEQMQSKEYHPGSGAAVLQPAMATCITIPPAAAAALLLVLLSGLLLCPLSVFQAYYDKSKVTPEAVDAYRLPQLVRGWESGEQSCCLLLLLTEGCSLSLLSQTVSTHTTLEGCRTLARVGKVT